MGRIGLVIALIIIVIIIITVIVVVIYFATRDEDKTTKTVDTGTTSVVDTTDTTAGATTDTTAGATTPIVVTAVEEDELATDIPNYGIGPGTGCDDGSCMYGVVRAKGAACRAIGGAMNDGTPDDTWTDCHLDFGRAHMHGLHPWGECPGGSCQDLGVRMITSDCRALRGRVDGNPAETAETLCHFNVGAQPKYRFYGRGACPTGGACRVARINARNYSQCELIGGTPDSRSTGGWTMCSLDLGSA